MYSQGVPGMGTLEEALGRPGGAAKVLPLWKSLKDALMKALDEALLSVAWSLHTEFCILSVSAL